MVFVRKWVARGSRDEDVVENGPGVHGPELEAHGADVIVRVPACRWFRVECTLGFRRIGGGAEGQDTEALCLKSGMLLAIREAFE